MRNSNPIQRRFPRYPITKEIALTATSRITVHREASSAPASDIPARSRIVQMTPKRSRLNDPTKLARRLIRLSSEGSCFVIGD